jgi:predicted nucleotidyltransferase
MAEIRSLDALKAELRALLPELRRRWPISYLGVFGSWVRDEQRPGSDLDLLVDFDGPLSGWGEIDLELELEQRLGLKVDLVPRPRLKPFIGARILREVQAA